VEVVPPPSSNGVASEGNVERGRAAGGQSEALSNGFRGAVGVGGRGGRFVEGGGEDYIGRFGRKVVKVCKCRFQVAYCLREGFGSRGLVVCRGQCKI